MSKRESRSRSANKDLGNDEWKGEGSRKHQSPPRIFRLPSPSRRGTGGEVAILRSSLLPMPSLSSPCPSPLPPTIICLIHHTANPDML